MDLHLTDEETRLRLGGLSRGEKDSLVSVSQAHALSPAAQVLRLGSREHKRACGGPGGARQCILYTEAPHKYFI